MNFGSTMARTILVALLLLPGIRFHAHPAQAAPSNLDLSARVQATDKALRWLYGRQNADGGFGHPSSDPQTTCEVVLAFASAYEQRLSVQTGNNSPLDYLATQVLTQTTSAEGTALVVLAVVAGNEDPREFRDSNLIATLEGYCQGSGQYSAVISDGIAAQALAIMALQVSKETVPLSAVTWLKNQQNAADGGWGPLPGRASDTEHTALSIQALIAAGESTVAQEVRDAVLYLQERQTGDAGFASSASASVSGPQSTSLAIQALLAAGENLLTSTWRRCLDTPFDALVHAQAGDGAFDDDLELTAAAVPGLMGRPLPVPGRFVAASKALEWLRSQQLEDGGFGSGGITADAVYVIELCERDADGAEWTKGGLSALEALEVETPGYIAGAPGGPAGELSKVIRAVHEAGGDPHYFAGRDLVGELKDSCEEHSPKCHPYKVFSHGLALIALHALSETIPAGAVASLEGEQLPQGGWPWAWAATTADVDSSGLSMQAIVAGGGPSSPEVGDNFAAFLESVRFANGAYPDVASRPEPNCNSTALAIEGLLAAGRYRREPLIVPLGTGGILSSWDALLAFQEPSGSFAFTKSSPESRLVATLEAVRALVSPLYPDYEPMAEGDGTKAGTAHVRLTCGQGLEIVAPFSGDDNNNGSASLSYRVEGNSSWSSPSPMTKTGIAYLLRPDLEAGADYEIEVVYYDADGVSNGATQRLRVYDGRGCLPLVLSGYAG